MYIYIPGLALVWQIAVSNMQQLTNSIRQSEVSCQQQKGYLQSSSHCFLCVTQTQCTCCMRSHCWRTQQLLLSSFYSLRHRLNWPVQWPWLLLSWFSQTHTIKTALEPLLLCAIVTAWHSQLPYHNWNHILCTVVAGNFSYILSHDTAHVC